MTSARPPGAPHRRHFLRQAALAQTSDRSLNIIGELPERKIPSLKKN